MYPPTAPPSSSAKSFSHSRVSYTPPQSFFGKLKNSLGGIIIGFVFIVLSGVLLFWNEGNAVHTQRKLDEGMSIVHSLPRPLTIQRQSDGQLVHAVDWLKVHAPLKDQDFDLSYNVAKLMRKVEMFQNVEEKNVRDYTHADGGVSHETSYYYSTKWESALIDSRLFDSPFSHENPTNKLVDDKTLINPAVFLGPFRLAPTLTQSLSTIKDLRMPSTKVVHLAGMKFSAFDGKLYSGNPSYPKVGDIRISWSYAGGAQDGDEIHRDIVTVIAQQQGEKLDEFRTSDGSMMSFVYMGDYTAYQVFQSELSRNSMQTWALRFVGWLLMFIGFSVMTSIIGVLVDWIPILRTLVGIGLGLINFLLSFSLALIVIAMGWIRYRPLIAGTILLLAVAIPYLFGRAKGQSKSSISQTGKSE